MTAIRISDAESQVMEVLWRSSPRTPDELIAEVRAVQDWAEGTIRTLITRLLKKGAIAGWREEGRYLYRPLVERAAYVQAESQGLLNRLFQGEVTPLVAHFAEYGSLSPQDIDALKRLIAELEDDN